MIIVNTAAARDALRSMLDLMEYTVAEGEPLQLDRNGDDLVIHAVPEYTLSLPLKAEPAPTIRPNVATVDVD